MAEDHGSLSFELRPTIETTAAGLPAVTWQDYDERRECIWRIARHQISEAGNYRLLEAREVEAIQFWDRDPNPDEEKMQRAAFSAERVRVYPPGLNKTGALLKSGYLCDEYFKSAGERARRVKTYDGATVTTRFEDWVPYPDPVARRCELVEHDGCLHLLLAAETTPEQTLAPDAPTSAHYRTVHRIHANFKARRIPYDQLTSFSIEDPDQFYLGYAPKRDAELSQGSRHIILAHLKNGSYAEVSHSVTNNGGVSNMHPLFQALTETFIAKRREAMRAKPGRSGGRRAHWSDDDVI